MRRTRRVLSALAAAATVSLTGLPGAAAAPADSGMLRLAHLSPDTPAVDVRIDSVTPPGVGITVAGVGYGMVSDYQAVAPGTYAVSVRAAGAAADTPPVLSTTVEVQPNQARTVAGLGRFADLGLSVLDDDLTPPPAGSARVRLLAAAGSAGAIAASIGGTAVSSGLQFATASGYVDVPGGAATLQLTADGGTASDLPVELAAGSTYSLLVLDRDGGGLTVSTALDAASPGVVPVGGVEAGAGGTAVDGGGPPAGRMALAGLAGLAGAALLLTVRVRLPHRGRPARHSAS